MTGTITRWTLLFLRLVFYYGVREDHHVCDDTLVEIEGGNFAFWVSPTDGSVWAREL